jgi:hypothetical protein
MVPAAPDGVPVVGMPVVGIPVVGAPVVPEVPGSPIVPALPVTGGVAVLLLPLQPSAIRHANAV